MHATMNIEQRSPLIEQRKTPRLKKRLILLLGLIIILLILLFFTIYVLFIDNIFKKETNDSLTDADIAHFIETIDGDVYQSPQNEYNETLLSVWNQRHSFTPLLIVFALTTNDITNTLHFVKKYSLSFSILGGGHNSVGWSMNNEIVLSMRYFKNISVININNSTKALSIGAGNRWYNVYNYMINNSLSSYIITGGLCPYVGIVGFTLGGGINGVCSREFGLNIDNVLEYQLITANGIKYILNNNNTEHDNNLKDLLWALKGGGGNNFGIVTNIVVKLNEPSSVDKAVLIQRITITAFNETYNEMDSLIDLLTFYHSIQDSLPRFIATFMLTYFEDNNLIFSLRIGCNNDKEICYNLLESFYVYLNDTNLIYSFRETYDNFIDALVGYTRENIPQYKDKIYLKSGYILNDGFESIIWNITLSEMIKRLYYPYNRTRVFFEQLGGKVSDVESDETAYFNRQNVDWVCQMFGSTDNIEERNDVIEWINVLHKNVTQYFAGGYVNYMDEYLLDWQEEYYGTNYKKLQCVKQLYDPTNIFSFEQSIQINRSLSCEANM